MKPITITDRAATRSPRNRTFKESREAERPMEKRAGTVPSPNVNMVRNPPRGLWVVAALIIMAQESMQGKNPVRSPRAIFEAELRERKKGEILRAIKDPVVMERFAVEEGRGRTFRSTRLSRIIKIPPVRVRLERSPPKNWLKLARWAMAPAKLPRRP